MKVERHPNPHIDHVVQTLSRNQVAVGFFDTAKYPDGTPVAYVAAIQEFGNPAGNLPARPFFRNAIAKNKQAFADNSRRGVLAAIEGRIAPEAMLEQLGMMGSSAVQESITDGSYEPLKQSTLDTKQSKKRTDGVSDKPLIDTAQMLQSVSYAVESKA